MKNIIRGEVSKGYYHEGNQHHSFWIGTGLRKDSEYIAFKKGQFQSKPDISVSIKHFDITSDNNILCLKLSVEEDSISHEGFNLIIETWGATRVAGVTAEWIAFD